VLFFTQVKGECLDNSEGFIINIYKKTIFERIITIFDFTIIFPICNTLKISQDLIQTFSFRHNKGKTSSEKVKIDLLVLKAFGPDLQNLTSKSVLKSILGI